LTDLVEVSFKLPKPLKRKVEQLIEAGVFVDKSEAFRAAVRDLLLKHAVKPKDCIPSEIPR
jgi:Arc/MetJ-type ribon-helix-helix transcriptional regulator